MSDKQNKPNDGKPESEDEEEVIKTGSIILDIMEQQKLTTCFGVASLSAKIVTLVSVIIYQTHVEEIPEDQILWKNFKPLMILIVWQHIHSILPYSTKLMETFSARGELSKKVIVTLAIIFLNIVIMFPIWPVCYWLDFSFTTDLDTDYHLTRYIFLSFYNGINFCRFGCLDNVKILFADGVLLSQLVTIYLYNELSFSAVLFCLTPFLLVQNCKLVLNILTYKDEPTWKTNFVRLLGTHDSIFMFVLFSSVICFSSIMDAFAYGSVHLLNQLYALLPLYAFGKLMEFQFNRKKLGPNVLMVPSITILMTLIALGIYFYTSQFIPCQFCEGRKYPLYNLNGTDIEEVVTEISASNEDIQIESLPWYLYIFSFIKYHRLITWYTYFVRPLWDWILYPLISVTIFPLWWLFSSFIQISYSYSLGIIFSQISGIFYSDQVSDVENLINNQTTIEL